MKLLAISLAVLLALCVAARADVQLPTATTAPSPGTGSGWLARLIVAADETHTDNTTYNTLSDLSFAVSANTNYIVRCILLTETTNSTSPAQLQVTGPASPTEVIYTRYYCNLDDVKDVSNTNDIFHTSSTDDAITQSTAVNRICNDQINLNIQNGANAGTVAFAFQPRTNTETATIHQGSWCEYSTY